MARSRVPAVALARLLDEGGAAYALDERRQLIFVSAALAAWLGFDAEELASGECNYQSPPGRSVEAARAALCPPPDVFSGVRRSGHVHWSSSEGRTLTRSAEFVPIPIVGDLAYGVLGFVGDKDLEPHEVSPTGAEPDELHALVAEHRRRFSSRYSADLLIGGSPAIARARAQARLAIETGASVLIVGPEGAGKEHLSKAIHYLRGGDRPGTLLPLDAASLTAELLLSTLSAAIRSHLPRLQSPATILIGNIDLVRPESQGELVSMLKASAALAAIIATTSRKLGELPAERLMLEELACLVSTILIELPPLNQRMDDLPALAQAFLEEINGEGRKQVGGFTSEALDLLMGHSWPRNLSELNEVVRESHTAATGALIALRDLPKQIHLTPELQRPPRHVDEPIDLPEFLAAVERELIERAMARSKGNKARAARLLGLTRPRLYRRMVQLGLVDPTFKGADDQE